MVDLWSETNFHVKGRKNREESLYCPLRNAITYQVQYLDIF